MAEAPLQSLTERLRPPPLSLYIHLPWCERKCPYCDFNSHQSPRELPEQQYIAALRADLEQAMPLVWGRSLHSVFIGGGTPSLFCAQGVAELITLIRMLFNPRPDMEITLEANPGSSEQQKFAAFADAGINRLSLGVQSFDDNSLQQIGRVHDGAASHAAAAAAQNTFVNFNIDLMHALPQQTLAAAISDVKTALQYAPPHLSLYQLTLEPQTPFYHTPPPNLPDADTTASITAAVCETAAAHGYHHYEVSAYAKDAPHRCAHNLNYWQYGDYLGIGAGAHSKLTTAGIVTRTQRIKNPQHYMQESPNAVAATQTPNRDEQFFEFMLNALRLTDGFNESLLTERLGVISRRAQQKLEAAEREGWLARTNHKITPTERGQRFLNDLTAHFLPH